MPPPAVFSSADPGAVKGDGAGGFAATAALATPVGAADGDWRKAVTRGKLTSGSSWAEASRAS